MHLLRDEEIIVLLNANPPLLTNFQKTSDWYSSKSIVQPSSLDLHVGYIFVPPTEEPEDPQKLSISYSNYNLKPGQTIVVTTLEKLNVPKNIAIFGFPPTSISDRAVLMTNPGHIDPGFKGHIRFTLINMGRESFTVTCKETKVVTLLLVKLEQDVNKGYDDRYSDPTINQVQPVSLDLYRLGKDFLDLDNRAKKAAEEVVRKEDLSLRNKQIWIPIVTALVAFIASVLTSFLASWQQSSGEIQDLERKIELLESQVDFDQRLDNLEQLNSNKSEED